MEIVREAVQAVLSFSSDAVVILLLVAGLSAYAFILGKGRAISLLISFYPAALLFKYLPFLKQYTVANPATSALAIEQAVIFLILVGITHIVLNSLISIESSYSKVRKILDSLILGVTTASIVIVCSYSVVTIKNFYNFSNSIDSLFASGLIFYWMFAPFVVIYLLRR